VLVGAAAFQMVHAATAAADAEQPQLGRSGLTPIPSHVPSQPRLTRRRDAQLLPSLSARESGRRARGSYGTLLLLKFHVKNKALNLVRSRQLKMSVKI